LSRKEVQLNQLEKGFEASVIRVTGQGATRRRLLEMGIIPGVRVAVNRVAPLGDPIDLLVKGYHLSLRRSEAAEVFVEVIE
jgi:Fe2+ transport system protein FeoA